MANRVKGVDRHDSTTYKEPTMAEPDMERTMFENFMQGSVSATDGCTVEPDGICPHGHVSWLLYWGVI